MKNFETELMQADCDVTLVRSDYSFEDDNGKQVSGSKFILRINGADVDLDFDKSSRNLLLKFIPYKPLEVEDEDD